MEIFQLISIQCLFNQIIDVIDAFKAKIISRIVLHIYLMSNRM